MTKSFEAYRYYSLIVDKAQAFENAEAVKFLQKAIQLDPNFAMKVPILTQADWMKQLMSTCVSFARIRIILLAHYHLAEAYERKGEREQAAAAYERFLQSWKHADPDIPEIENAKGRFLDASPAMLSLTTRAPSSGCRIFRQSKASACSYGTPRNSR